MRTLSWLVLLVASAAWAQVTKTTTSVTVANCGTGSASSEVDVYRPSGVGPFGLVAIGHGFQNSKDNAAGLAQGLADLGLVVVVVPQFPGFLSPCGSDHARNARVLLAAVDQQVSRGDIDTALLGFAGHSAGGLSAFLAAAQRPAAALVLLDPVDSNNLGLTAAPNVSAPSIFLVGEPSTCNSQGNATGWFSSVVGPKARLKVVNANHCDPQEPISGVCTFGCGGPGATSTVRSAIFKRYAVAFFNRYLRGQAMPCLEATAQTDATAGTVSQVDFRLGGCVAAVDAGVDAGVAVDAGVDAGVAVDAGVDAGALDAGLDAGATIDAGTPDAGTNEDAGVQLLDAGTEVDAGPTSAAPPTGCGCLVGEGWGALLFAPLMLLRRRRA